MKRKRKVGGLIVCALLALPAIGQSGKQAWVDSVFHRLTLDEKIGQLFLVPVGTDPDELDAVENRIRSLGIGGVLFKNGIPVDQPSTAFALQRLSRVPLFTSAQGHILLSGTRQGMPVFPDLLQLGAVANDTLIRMLGSEVGRRMSALGLNLHFSSANVLSPGAKAIHLGYGENQVSVAAKSVHFFNGLRESGVMSCGTVFPLDAIPVTQPQKGMPSLVLTADSAQTLPFRALIGQGITAMVPDPTVFPDFYHRKKSAVAKLLAGQSMKPGFAGQWLRGNFDYNGLLFADVDGMAKGSAKFQAGDAEVFAFKAGHDVLMTSAPLGPAVRKMKKLLKTEKEYRAQLDESVRRILGAKYDGGLAGRRPDVYAPLAEANAVQSYALAETLFHAAVSVVRNEEHALPIRLLEDKTFKIVVADDSLGIAPFSTVANKYVQASVIAMAPHKTLSLRDPLRKRQVVLVVTTPASSDSTVRLILNAWRSRDPFHEFIFCDFGAAALQKYASQIPSLITGYANQPEIMKSVAQAVFGAMPATGTLPVAFQGLPAGTGHKTGSLQRLGYSFPGAQAMDARTLDRIEAIAQEAIENKATPGCHVLVARHGKVVYEKSFGHFTYEKQAPVTDETIYDLASVTKVAATLQTVMFMHDRGLIDLNKKASVYLPELRESNKKDFTLKDILTHQAGLWPFLPFWVQTLKDTTYLPEFYSKKPSAQYPYFVSDRLFASASMRDSLWTWIIKSKVREKPDRTPYDYRYSDMGFYMLQHLAEKILNQPMEDFLSQNLYEPLGATRMGYLPLLRFSIHNIAPTENDKLFRRSLLIGAVHDQGAAMHGGVAGHAGLFGTATDLAKLGQMLLQEGTYGGIRYYKPETVRLFTSKQYETSRRGLGWDKPTVGDWNGPTSYYASPKTFGHTGFTGTAIWVDPEFDLIYIFLSNRVHPDMTNTKLLTANIRSRIQDAIYQSIFNFCKTIGEPPEDGFPVDLQPIGRSQ